MDFKHFKVNQIYLTRRVCFCSVLKDLIRYSSSIAVMVNYCFIQEISPVSDVLVLQVHCVLYFKIKMTTMPFSSLLVCKGTKIMPPKENNSPAGMFFMYTMAFPNI